MRWRHLFRVLHRDIGYVCVALSLAYGLSGLAVNHIEDWNPNYKCAPREVDIGPPEGTTDERAKQMIAKLELDPRQVRGHFAETDTQLRVFLPEGQEAVVDTRTGRGTLKTVTTRAVLFEVNSLHLNNLKGAWTYVADLFAIALMFLALTGAVMMKGDRGITGRGKYFLGAGLAIPIAAIVYLYA